MAEVDIPAEITVAAALRMWVLKGLRTSIPLVASLLTAWFGHKPSQQEATNAMGPWIKVLAAPVHAIDTMFNIQIHLFQTIYNTFAKVKGYAYNLTRDESIRREQGDIRTGLRARSELNAETVRRLQGDIRAEDLAKQLSRDESIRREQGDIRTGLQARAELSAETIRREQGDIREAQTRAQADIAESIRREQGDIRTAAYADAVSTDKAAAARKAVEVEVTQASAATWPQTLTEVDAATAAAGTDLPDLRALLKAVPRTAAATLGEAAADPASVDRVLLRALTDCVIPNCRNLSKAGRDLQSLFGLVEGAAFLAFIAAMIEAPEQTARDTVDVLEPLLHGAVSGFESLIGL